MQEPIKRMIVYFFIILILTFILTVLTSRWLIPKLKSHKMGQKILDVGPRWHKSKEGTPTMGGLSFLFAILVTTAVVLPATLWRREVRELPALLLTLLFAYLNGAIGFLDDYVKFFKKRNEGLSAPQKYLLQLIAAAVYLFGMKLTGSLTTTLLIPYFGVVLELGPAYYIIALLLLTGVVNAVNLTDGIDGLAGSVTFIVACFFGIASLVSGKGVFGFPSVMLSALTAGACLGFLVYNFHPARVFMGDTGSLFLGGMVVGMAFLCGNPLIVVVAGLLYIIETASVMLQVAYFKLTHGKRLFKMAPIHHHFEKCGWSEVKVVSVFTVFTAFMCALAWLGL